MERNYTGLAAAIRGMAGGNMNGRQIARQMLADEEAATNSRFQQARMFQEMARTGQLMPIEVRSAEADATAREIANDPERLSEISRSRAYGGALGGLQAGVEPTYRANARSAEVADLEAVQPVTSRLNRNAIRDYLHEISPMQRTSSMFDRLADRAANAIPLQTGTLAPGLGGSTEQMGGIMAGLKAAEPELQLEQDYNRTLRQTALELLPEEVNSRRAETRARGAEAGLTESRSELYSQLLNSIKRINEISARYDAARRDPNTTDEAGSALQSELGEAYDQYEVFRRTIMGDLDGNGRVDNPRRGGR